MAATVELGQLCLSYPRVGLELTADVVVVASSPQETDGENFTTNISAVLTSGSGWVCRGRGFHLALDVSVNGNALDNHVQQYLVNSICSADLWKQLDLKASLTPQPMLTDDLPATTEQGARVVIRLTHSTDDVPLNTRHRLPAGASISDVQPPAGVEVVHLNAVRLVLRFATSDRKGRGAKQNRKGTRARGLSTASMSMLENGDSVEKDDQPMILQEEAMLLEDSLEMVADATFPSGNELLYPHPSSSFPQRIDSGTAFTDDQLGRARPEHLVELVDSTLRLAICEKPPKLPSGIKIIRDNVAKLATVAPALWRPNYLRLVSGRAPFLPTIAHALSHSLLVNARSAPLKRKAAELLGHYPPVTFRAGPLSPSHAQQDKGLDSVYEAASIGLWNLLQRASFDSGANLRLKPLKTRPKNDDEEGLNESDGMLFDDLGTYQPVLCPFADEYDPGSFLYSSYSQPDEEMLWQCQKEDGETDMDSAYEIPVPPCENEKPPHISRPGDTDEDMLVEWDNLVESGKENSSGNILEAQDPAARSESQVSTAFRDVEGESSLFEVTGSNGTLIPADAYDRLLADPEVLFNYDF